MKYDPFVSLNIQYVILVSSVILHPSYYHSLLFIPARALCQTEGRIAIRLFPLHSYLFLLSSLDSFWFIPPTPYCFLHTDDNNCYSSFMIFILIYYHLSSLSYWICFILPRDLHSIHNTRIANNHHHFILVCNFHSLIAIHYFLFLFYSLKHYNKWLHVIYVLSRSGRREEPVYR